MRIFSDINELSGLLFSEGAQCAVVIGKFDGLHLGHRKLIQKALDYRKEGIRTLIFTFDRSPGDFFSGVKSRLLMTDSERDEALRRLKADYEYVMKVTKESMSILPEDFIKLLSEKLCAKVIAAGPDLSFGRKGEGNLELLFSLSGRYGYRAEEVKKLCYQGVEISSSRIRRAVEEGKLEDAGAMLSRPYSIRGRVIPGKKLGRTMGVPTANILPPPEKLLPPAGVYFSEIKAEGKVYGGVTNIGVRPTVSQEETVNAESFLFNFDGDLYGKDIEIALKHFERPEKRFADLQKLQEQLRKDLEQGRKYYGENV